MSHWIYFFLGLFAGAFIGVATMAIIQIGANGGRNGNGCPHRRHPH